MKPDKLVAQRVAEARKARGLSQAALGSELQEFLRGKWQAQSISAIEMGKRPLRVAELPAFSWVLGRPVGWFLAPEDDRENFDMPTGKVIPAGWFRRPADAAEILAGLGVRANELVELGTRTQELAKKIAVTLILSRQPEMAGDMAKQQPSEMDSEDVEGKEYGNH